MKKLFLFFVLISFGNALFGQKIEGRIVLDGIPVPNVAIFIKDLNIKTLTDKNGYYELKDLPTGENVMVVAHQDYEKILKKVTLKENETLNLKDIEVKQVGYQQEVREEIARIALEDVEVDDEESALQSGSIGLLGATQDVFTKAAAWVWGPLRFRIRGYDSKYATILLNGIDLKDLENSRPSYSLWSGLNDAVRNSQTILTLSPTEESFGAIGGVRSISIRASEFRKGTKVSYAHTNRTYSSRVMATHATGLMRNNLAATISVSRRVGQDQVYQEGTFYDAWGYFFSLEKKLNDAHSLGIIAFGTPNKRGGYGATTKEIYELTGNNYYNRYWGYQNGKPRNARIKNRHQPVIMLSHYWDIGKSSHLQTTASYKFGKYGSTRIERYDSYSDRPDYYRDRPSYYYLKGDKQTAQAYETLWRTSPPQVAWDYFYRVNYHNVDEIENANGINNNSYIGHRSKYILENKIQDDSQWGIKSFYRNEINEKFTINAGITFNYLKRNYYKEVDDLLGGDYFVDIDQYAKLDFPNSPDKYQNDVQKPNRIVKKGDRFGYDYNIYAQNYHVFGQGRYDSKLFNFFFGFKLGGTDYQREGFMQNGLSADYSLGKSKRISFKEYGIKSGLTYKIDGRNFASVNLALEQKTPETQHTFIIPEENNLHLSDIKEEKVISAEAGYVYRSPKLKARATGYYTTFENSNQRNISLLYSNLGGGDIGFLFQFTTGINKLHYGVELGFDYEVYSGLNIHGAASIGKHTFMNNPRFRAYEDHTASARFDEPTYLRNFYANESPQKVYSFGLNYRHPKYIFFNVEAKFLHDNFLQASPLFRTQALFNGALQNYATDPLNPSKELIYDIVYQEDLPDAFMVDVSIGKSILFSYTKRMYLTLMVTNLLNNTNYITGGYEDMGYFGSTYRYRPNYYYAFGRTYYLLASFRF